MSARWSGWDWSSDVGTMIPLHKSDQSTTYLIYLSITRREKYVKKKFFKAKKFMICEKLAQKSGKMTYILSFC